jgi:chromosome segregation ATPase
MPAEHDDPISREMAADIHHPTGVPKSRDAGRQRTEKTHPDPPGSEANKSSAQMLAEIASLKKELSSSNAKVDGLRKALDVAQKNLGEAKSKLENISSSPNTPGLDMEDMLGRIRELAAEVEKTRKELGGSPGTM